MYHPPLRPRSTGEWQAFTLTEDKKAWQVELHLPSTAPFFSYQRPLLQCVPSLRACGLAYPGSLQRVPPLGGPSSTASLYLASSGHPMDHCRTHLDPSDGHPTEHSTHDP